MIGWFLASSLRLRRLILVIAGGVLLVGVSQLRNAPVETLPELAPTMVQIQTEALGLSAVEVEQLVTVPMEQDLLSGLPWLQTMRSRSLPGLSSIELVFQPGTDLLRARQVVQERLAQAAGLPNVSAPPQMLQPVSSTSRAMMIRFSSTTRSQIQMSVLARWTIRPRLLGVPGVANVSIWGLRERQLQVQVDPARLRNQGISLQSVIETAGNALWASPLTFLEASTPGTGGFIDTENQRLGIQHLQPIARPADLAQVPLEQRDGKPPLRLGDVATVVEGHQPLIGDAIFNGAPSLLLVVEKFPGASTFQVTRDVQAALDAMRPGLPGIRVDPWVYRPATFIQRSVSSLTIALVIGLILAVLALGALLFEWRRTLVIVVTVVLSVVVAALVLFLLGAQFNATVLAGLVLGLVAVIDDAIVDVDNVVRRLRERRNEDPGVSATDVVVAALHEMRSAAAYAALIITLAAVPLFFIQTRSSAFFPPLVLSYVLAVSASMAVALVVTPALVWMLLSKASLTHREGPLTRWLASPYGRALSRTTRSPRLVYAAVAVAIVAGVVVLPFMRQSLLPTFRDSNLLVRWNAPPGTSLPEMDRITGRAVRELATVPGIADAGGNVGRALTSDQVVDVNSGELWLRLDPTADYQATVAAVESVLNGYPGIESDVLTYPNERIAQILPPTDDPIVVRVYGQNLNVLNAKAEQVRAAIAQIDGVADPRVQLPAVQVPGIQIQVDLNKAQRYGIKPGDVRRASAALVSGISVGSLFENQKVFDVVVLGVPQVRSSLTSVRNLLIDRPGRGQVRLGDVAEANIAPQPSVIQHDGTSRYVDVVADVSGRDAGAVQADVERQVSSITFPLEYRAELVGNYTAREAAERRALAIAVAVGIGVFLLLQAAFMSWQLATMFFLALPMALSGGVLAAFIDGRVFSLGAVIGLFAVLGIAVRNGIASIRHFQYLEQHPGAADLVSRGAQDRLGAVLMTAAASVAVLLPLVLSGEAAGYELVHPMAVVIVGGMVTSMLLNLFVTPALYARFRSSWAAGAVPGERVVRVPDLETAPPS